MKNKFLISSKQKIQHFGKLNKSLKDWLDEWCWNNLEIENYESPEEQEADLYSIANKENFLLINKCLNDFDDTFEEEYSDDYEEEIINYLSNYAKEYLKNIPRKP